MWDVAAGRATATLTDQFGPDQISLAFTADGRRLAIATDGPEGAITLWDVAGQPTAEPWIMGDGYWSNPTFSSDGRWLAVDDSKGVEL